MQKTMWFTVTLTFILLFLAESRKQCGAADLPNPTRTKKWIPWPSINIPNLPSVNIPNIPSIDIPNLPSINIPNLPSINIPNLPSVNIPNIPSINIPNLPSIDIPNFPSIDIPNLPSINIPNLPSNLPNLPSIDIPNLPSVNIPNLPSIDLPNLPSIDFPNLPSINLPNLPSIDLPNLPSINIPNFPSINIPNLPSINIPNLPSIDIPNLFPTNYPNVPSIDIPNPFPTNLPNLDYPSIDIPKFPSINIPSLPELTPAVKLNCPPEVDPVWGITWSPAAPGDFVSEPCPNGFIGNIHRYCGFDGEWSSYFTLETCIAFDYEELKSEAKEYLASASATVEGALYIIDQLANLTIAKSVDLVADYYNISESELSTINFVIQEVLEFLIQKGFGNKVENVIELLNSALDIHNKDSWLELQKSVAASEILLHNAELYGLYLGRTLNLSKRTVQYSRKNIAIRADLYGIGEQLIADYVFPVGSDLVNTSAVTNENYIKISSAYLKALTNNSSVIVVSILFPSLQKFLPYNHESQQSAADVIISSQVHSTSSNHNEEKIQDLLQDNPIELTFSIEDSFDAIDCVFWNFTTDFNSTSFGSWVPDGITSEIVDASTVKCRSRHLTAFSVLVDVVPDSNVTKINPVEEEILSVVSYIGCSVSIVCLTITVIWLMSLGKILFLQVHNFIHLCLSISLLLGLIVFVGGIQHTSSIKPLCKFVAAVLHYLFLSAFCWMLCEAIMLFLMLVIVFSKMTKKWWLYCIIGWGLPVLPVAITLGIGLDHYTQDNGICWLNNSNHLIWGFVGPMIIIIIVNAVVLVIVMVKLFQNRNSRVTGKESSIKEAKEMTIHLVKGAVVLLPLLGVTWILGVFAVNSNTTVFAWLFTVSNSLQGAFIFFFHVLNNKKLTERIKNSYYKKKKRRNTMSQLSRKNKSSLLKKMNSETEESSFAYP